MARHACGVGRRQRGRHVSIAWITALGMAVDSPTAFDWPSTPWSKLSVVRRFARIEVGFATRFLFSSARNRSFQTMPPFPSE